MKTIMNKTIGFICLSIFALLAGCNSESIVSDYQLEEQEALKKERQYLNGNIQDLANARSYNDCENSDNCNNCVDFAACRGGFTFPWNLSTKEGKCYIINKSEPEVGYIAIMDTQAPEEHVGYVFYVSSKGSRIGISEGNYNGKGECRTSINSVSSFNIKGYYKYGDGLGKKSCEDYHF